MNQEFHVHYNISWCVTGNFQGSKVKSIVINTMKLISLTKWRMAWVLSAIKSSLPYQPSAPLSLSEKQVWLPEGSYISNAIKMFKSMDEDIIIKVIWMSSISNFANLTLDGHNSTVARNYFQTKGANLAER